jgi:hypothetical protein
MLRFYSIYGPFSDRKQNDFDRPGYYVLIFDVTNAVESIEALQVQ